MIRQVVIGDETAAVPSHSEVRRGLAEAVTKKILRLRRCFEA